MTARHLGITLLLAALAPTAVAQTPLLEIDYHNATVFHVRSDGKLLLPLGAANGYVLTSDAQGLATWMPAPSGGLTLPFAGTTASSSTAFSVENTGTGLGLDATTQATALRVLSAASEGLRVSQAGTRGVFVASSGQAAFGAQFVGGDGVNIFRAGNPTTTNSSALNNGFEVAGAEGYGLYVGRSDQSGINVALTGAHGLFVGNAADDGVHVTSAGDKAGYFGGDVEVTGALVCPGCVEGSDVDPLGGIYAGKSAIYVSEGSATAPVGGCVVVSATCNDANDMPLQGFCKPPVLLDTNVKWRDASDWDSLTNPAAFSCEICNDANTAVMITASMVCIGVQ